MSDDTVEVKIKASAEQFESGMEHAAEATESSVAQIKEHLEGLHEQTEKLQEGFERLFALITTGGAFAEAIEKTNEWAESVEHLSHQMGVTGDQAATFIESFKLTGQSTADAEQALNSMQRQLHSNEQAWNDMGIATRDSQGNFKDMNTLFEESLSKIREYKEGQDQASAAAELFGARGAKQVVDYLKITPAVTAEATAAIRGLNLETGEGTAQALAKWNEATGLANAAMTKLSQVVGNDVMPVFEDLMKDFTEAVKTHLPELEAGAKLAASGLLVLVDSGDFVIDIFKMIGKVIGDTLGAISVSLTKIGQGDLSGAWAAMQEGTDQVSSDWQAMNDEIDADDQKVYDKIKALWSDDPHKPEGGGEEGGDGPKGGKSFHKAAPPTDELKEATDAFNQMKLAREAALDPVTGAEEVAFWQRVEASAKEYGFTQEQIAQVRKNIMQGMANDAKEEEAAEIAAEQAELDAATAKIKVQADASKAAVQEAQQQSQMRTALGSQTRSEELANEMTFAQMRGQIEAQQFQKLADLYADDEKKQAEYLLAKQKAEEKSQQDIAKLQIQAAQQSAAVYEKAAQGLTADFTKAFDGLIKGTENWNQAGRKLETDLADTAISAIEKTTAKFIGDQLLKMVIGKTTHESQVQQDAGEAAAGAYKATVGIPFVGPVLAPAAAATAYVAVMAFAEQGFDVPAGENPITQLHQREMVLPQEHADTIRNMAGGGGGGGGGSTFHIHAQDSQDVAKFLARNGRDVAKVVAGQISGAHFRGKFL
jgi:hypothetical protein